MENHKNPFFWGESSKRPDLDASTSTTNNPSSKGVDLDASTSTNSPSSSSNNHHHNDPFFLDEFFTGLNLDASTSTNNPSSSSNSHHHNNSFFSEKTSKRSDFDASTSTNKPTSSTNNSHPVPTTQQDHQFLVGSSASLNNGRRESYPSVDHNPCELNHVTSPHAHSSSLRNLPRENHPFIGHNSAYASSSGMQNYPFADHSSPNESSISMRSHARPTYPVVGRDPSELNYGFQSNCVPSYGSNAYQNHVFGLMGENFPITSNTSPLFRSSNGWMAPTIHDPQVGVYCSIFKFMTDQRGLVFQDYLETCDNRAKIDGIVNYVTSDAQELVRVAKDEFGNISVMKLINFVKGESDLCKRVTSALAMEAHELMTNHISATLVPYCLDNLEYNDSSFLVEAALRYFDKLAKNKTGCKSLKKCIKNSKNRDKTRLLNMLLRHSATLANHSTGNFVVQFALEKYDHIVSETICLQLGQHIREYVMNGYGSYVIEKCLKSSHADIILGALSMLGKEELKELAGNCKGNYVLQTALKAKGHYRDQLFQAMKQLLAELDHDMHTTNVIKLMSTYIDKEE